MSRIKPAATATLFSAALLSLATTPSALAQSEWFLMQRHGGCVSLEAAGRRRDEFQGITDPEMFIDRLRDQGAAVEVNETSQGDVTIVEVTAPALGLAVVFVPSEVCQ